MKTEFIITETGVRKIEIPKKRHFCNSCWYNVRADWGQCSFNPGIQYYYGGKHKTYRAQSEYNSDNNCQSYRFNYLITDGVKRCLVMLAVLIILTALVLLPNIVDSIGGTVNENTGLHTCFNRTSGR